MKKRSHTTRAARARRAAAPRVKRPGLKRTAPPRARRAAAGRSAVALPAECTLAGAEGLKLKLAALLKNVKSVTVDVSGVRRIDSASLQLLAAFARDRRADGLPVELSGESAAFAEGAQLLGLSPLLSG